jgi:hypothetical protein
MDSLYETGSNVTEETHHSLFAIELEVIFQSETKCHPPRGRLRSRGCVGRHAPDKALAELVLDPRDITLARPSLAAVVLPSRMALLETKRV